MRCSRWLASSSGAHRSPASLRSARKSRDGPGAARRTRADHDSRAPGRADPRLRPVGHRNGWDEEAGDRGPIRLEVTTPTRRSGPLGRYRPRGPRQASHGRVDALALRQQQIDEMPGNVTTAASDPSVSHSVLLSSREYFSRVSSRPAWPVVRENPFPELQRRAVSGGSLQASRENSSETGTRNPSVWSVLP